MERVSGYVFLTEEMNKKSNLNNKPFMIMEGLADVLQRANKTKTESEHENKKILLYSGGLFAIDGIIELLYAFSNLQDDELEFHIYGNGNLVEDIINFTRFDKRIKYFGYIQNSKLVKYQSSATLLVNPRFTNHEYTKFSFPSKIIEYMTSGVPTVTTKIAGIPEEYFQYLYAFNEETIDGFNSTLKTILSKPKLELLNFGMVAKEFILKEKNNKIQAVRLYDSFIEQL
jgi:glycosyltransferase involved in cell wall biosynthesis